MAAPEPHKSAESDNIAKSSSRSDLMDFKKAIPSPTLKSWSQVSDSQRSIGPVPDFEGRPVLPRKLDEIFSEGEEGDGGGLVLTSLQERDQEIQKPNEGSWIETLKNHKTGLITTSCLLLLPLIIILRRSL